MWARRAQREAHHRRRCPPHSLPTAPGPPPALPCAAPLLQRGTIKVVPRLDLAAVAARKPEDARANFGKAPKVKPAARPFNPEDARTHRLDVVQQRDRATGDVYFILNGSQRFLEGCAGGRAGAGRGEGGLAGVWVASRSHTGGRGSPRSGAAARPPCDSACTPAPRPHPPLPPQLPCEDSGAEEPAAAGGAAAAGRVTGVQQGSAVG